MGHSPSSGQPYTNTNPDGNPFAPAGEPKRVQEVGGASSEGTAPDEGDAALAELGAGLKKKTRSASGTSSGKVALPTASEGLRRSPYNRPGP